jgi:hypothetical protein
MNAFDALKREFPNARCIEFTGDLWHVYVGDNYYEEIYAYSVKNNKLVYVGLTIVDAA